MTGGLLSALFSGMWHGYRRWMTLFNSLSIVLSVTLAMVILGFTHGVRRYVDDMVRKEAAAGAVRIHAGGWQVERADESFSDRVRTADRELTPEETSDYLGYSFWSRSEAHYLMPGHPADSALGGVFVKTGNTRPADPEAARVAPYAVAGRWIEDPEAHEIVLDQAAAIKLAKRIEEISSAKELLGREIWITLPPTRDHLPGACAQVEVVGIFDHLRDGACMTTSRVIQDMHARTQANAYGKWYETYDRLRFHVRAISAEDPDDNRGTGILPVSPARQGVPPEDGQNLGLARLNERLTEAGGAPLVCWRTRDDTDRWFSARGPIGQQGETESTRELRAKAEAMRERLKQAETALAVCERAWGDAELLLQGSAETRQWLADLDQLAEEAFGESATPETVGRLREMLQIASDRLDLEYDLTGITSPEAYRPVHHAITGGLAKVQGNVIEEQQNLSLEMSRLKVDITALKTDIAVRDAQAERLASESLLPTGTAAVVEVQVSTRGTDIGPDAPTTNAVSSRTSVRSGAVRRYETVPLMAGGSLRTTFPPSEHGDLEALDAKFPDGYVLCSQRIWNELGYAAAPSLPVDDWREHALYAYLYFDGLRPALAAREQLKQWGFETYMPIDRFKGLLALVRVVTWAAVALLAAVLLAGLLGIVVTLYTEVDAEEAEIGLLKALGASNRLVGLVFLCKGALVGLIGVVIGVPLAALAIGRINAGVSGAVTRAAGLAEVEAGLFSQDPRLVFALGVLIVALSALAALLPALQASGKDPQEALRAE